MRKRPRSNIDALFEKAIQIPAEEREAWLRRACPDDSLRDEIASLLHHHDLAAGPLDESFDFRHLQSPDDFQDSDADERDRLIGTEIGPYRITRFLGEGGMGLVYLADQREPVRREVALKITRAGLATRDVVRRFESERQALALMDHPTIARIYDARETEDGRPYFTMEYVPGIPINRYCDRFRLRVRDRLRLFLSVCDGVQHAHQKGIIHRDLKPSNILVSVRDGSPTAKIIDFGVAKALHRRLTLETLVTQQGILIGTPDYMSPEQASSSGLDVDTRSDVYSLGVVLYELLTGSLPFALGAEETPDLLEMQRRIATEAPATPSARLATIGDRATTVAGQRRTSSSRLKRLLRQDLDWIVMRALEKDRVRRYGSAQEFADDVRRYLAGEPVSAGPPTIRYRLRKAIRRHKTALVAGSFVLLALTAGTVASVNFALRERAARQTALEQAEEAKQAALRAQTVADFFRETIYGAAPAFAQGEELTVREALRDAALRIDESFEDDPVSGRTVRMALGEVYVGLGLHDEAEAHFRKALTALRATSDDVSADLAFCLESLGNIDLHRKRIDPARRNLEEALTLYETEHGRANQHTLRVVRRLAHVAMLESRLVDALEGHRRVLETHESLSGRESYDYASAELLFVNFLILTGHYDDAIAHLDHAWGVFQSHPNNLIKVLRIHALRGSVHRHRGDWASSAKHLILAKAITDSIYREDVPRRMNVERDLGMAWVGTGRYDDAEAILESVLSRQVERFHDEHRDVMLTQLFLGELHRAKGEFASADRAYGRALDICEKTYGDRKNFTAARILQLRGAAAAERGNLNDAEAYLRASISERDGLLPADHPHTLATGHLLSDVLMRRGDSAGARAVRAALSAEKISNE